MDVTLVTVTGAAAITAAWVLGRTERPAARREIRRQEQAAAAKDIARLRGQADAARQAAATAQANARARAGELADANAALGQVQKLADELRATDPHTAARITAAATGHPTIMEGASA